MPQITDLDLVQNPQASDLFIGENTSGTYRIYFSDISPGMCYPSGHYMNAQDPTTYSQAVSIVADRVYCIPFRAYASCNIAELYTYVNVTGTATSGYLGIYKPVLNRSYHYELYHSAGLVGLSSVGLKTASSGVSLSAGVYIGVIFCNGTWTNLGGHANNICTPLFVGQLGSINGGKILYSYINRSFSSGLPTVISGVTFGATTCPSFGVRT